MKAVILAAGVGKRLKPITDKRPKHLLEVGGRSILRRILDPLIASNEVTEIHVVTHYFEQLIQDAVKEWYPTTNKILFIHQESLQGTGDAFKTAFPNVSSEPIITIYGDLILGDAIEKSLYKFKKRPGNYILGAKVADPERFGVISESAGEIVGIEEKPVSPPEDCFINAGLFIFPAIATQMIHEIQENEKRGEIEITDLFSTLISNGEKFTMIKAHEGWFDVGTPASLLLANSYVISHESDLYSISGMIEEGVTMKGNVYVGENAVIRSGSYIEGPCFIDEGADIGPNCFIRKNSYLGKNVRIGNGCEVKNSIIYHNSHAAHLSYVGDSVLGQNVNFGAGTITANLRHDKKNVKITIDDKRIDSGLRKLGAIIGDNAKTGIGVNLLPGVKVSSNKWINAGETVTKDI